MFCLTDGFLTAVETINALGEHMTARKLLSSGRLVSSDQLEREAFDMLKMRRSGRLVIGTDGAHSAADTTGPVWLKPPTSPRRHDGTRIGGGDDAGCRSRGRRPSSSVKNADHAAR